MGSRARIQERKWNRLRHHSKPCTFHSKLCAFRGEAGGSAGLARVRALLAHVLRTCPA